uniref:ATP synthase F0 subunit 6 n=1 Tax=Cloacotaenia megalops TaxID=576527 RepID=A0A1L2FZF3_9CEST|nr:ATP synthase F0 subunit 6 [Cloacotaenia megalops]AOG66049.1 ATP synthase F0 subunit 6 [Cloacotaenia megalops]
MLNVFNNFSTIVSLLYNFLINVFSGYYCLLLSSVLLLFLSYRFPYCYSPFIFSVFLVCVVFSAFLSLFFTRLCENYNEFFSSFIPVGTPIYICPLVCLAETISYIIRPIVLILRPFINISLGCFGTVALCNLCFTNYFWLIVVAVLFFYELFVAVVHWYIVTSILSFSINH